MKDKAASAVYVQAVTVNDKKQIEEAVETLFAELPVVARLGPGSRVLIKPNLLTKATPQRAVTTHPDVLLGVVLALQRRGVQHITVADSPGGPYTPAAIRGIYQGCGVADVCAQTGAVAYTDCNSGPRAANGKLVREFTLIQPVLESDFIINLPKMKSHVLTGFSGAVKNLFGTVPGLQKPEFHMRFPEREHFADMLVDLCETVKADMHIVDGVIAMEGDGPGSGTPRECGLLLAGENPYNVDLALCRYMGICPKDTPIMAAAIARGLCGQALDETLLVGDEVAKRPVQGYKGPRSYTGKLDFSGNLPKLFQPLMPAFRKWASPRPYVRKKQRIGCGKCAEICPKQIISIRDNKAFIHPKECIHCFCCHEMCPVKAVDIKRNRLFGL